MDRRRKKMIASMLVIAMVLSNSNVPGFAGNVSGEEESVIVEPDQETDGRSGTQEGTADAAGTSDGEDTKRRIRTRRSGCIGKSSRKQSESCSSRRGCGNIRIHTGKFRGRMSRRRNRHSGRRNRGSESDVGTAGG